MLKVKKKSAEAADRDAKKKLKAVEAEDKKALKKAAAKKPAVY